MQFLSEKSVRSPKTVMRLVAIICLLLIAIVALPSFKPDTFSFLHPVVVDTDPENMLSPEEPVRVFHNEQKKKFSLYDMIVVGVVDTSSEEGVFTPQTLKNVYALTDYIKSLQWQKDSKTEGVISVDVMAPSTVDNIEQAGLGSVSFSWLMSSPPESEEEALAIRDKAQNLPMLNGSLVSEDGKALSLYVPLTSKSVSYDVAKKIKEKVATFNGSTADYHITGLPVAQDQFGVEMFVQMAISAPAAMALIFLLMWVFFRNVKMIISPMLVAMASVIFTMGLLVATGNTVHIMSSMIPIFIMPIAVLDAVHILSDFFDRYQKTKDRKKTLRAVMEELSAPMLYTSITTAAGFGSLALTPIPPVQVFGIFIALGVIFAWLLTITMIPAYIMLLSDKALDNFGMAHEEGEASTPLAKLLNGLGRFTFAQGRFIAVLLAVCIGGAYYGITKIQINDNPVKWFNEKHEIRVADKALNERFAGTYMAYLSLKSNLEKPTMEVWMREAKTAMSMPERHMNDMVADQLMKISFKTKDHKEIITELENRIEEYMDSTEDDALWEQFDVLLQKASTFKQRNQIFKDPEVLHYMEGLQKHLVEIGLVGKSNSVVDVVKTVYRELFGGKESAFFIPDDRKAVAQTLLTFQNSHRPDDLWKFVTPDYDEATIWLQLKSGDNKDMGQVVAAVDAYMQEHKAPARLQAKWFGLTYINVIWQDKMVKGMLESFGSSFIVVLLLMALLFRSLIWGMLAMVPLTVTIGMIYGLIGLIGKDYDMPVAVLSSLSLGLAVDYAIHFLARGRYLYTKAGKWKATNALLFGEPARAIARNVIVLGVGFMPLLLAPLIPYQTVGIFISAILLLAGIATLIILPVIIKPLEKILFKTKEKA